MYANGKIYAIICRKTQRRYVGSTCEPTLAKRLAQHVQDFKNWKEGKVYFSSFDIIKDGDYYIVLLELYPCNSKDELRMCEQKHIDLGECVNKRKAFQSEEDFKECRKKWCKTYYEKNRNEILEHHKQNRNVISEKHKQYRQQNNDKINAKLREKICCPTCQKEMNKSSLLRHKKICPQLVKEIETDVI